MTSAASVYAFCATSQTAHVISWLYVRSAATSESASLTRILQLVMRCPAVLLADIWCRGWSDSSTFYGQVVNWAYTSTAWFNEQWSSSHFDYLKHTIIVVALILMSCHNIYSCYMFLNVFGETASLQLTYCVSQQLIDLAVRRHTASKILDESSPLLDILPAVLLVVFAYATICANSALFWLSLPYIEKLVPQSKFSSRFEPLLLAHGIYFIAPVLLQVGLPVWLCQWINWAVCGLVAFIGLCNHLYVMNQWFLSLGADFPKSFASSCAVSWLAFYAVNTIAAASGFTGHYAGKAEAGLFSLPVNLLHGLSESSRSLPGFLGVCVVAGYVAVAVNQIVQWFVHCTASLQNADLAARLRGTVSWTVCCLGVQLYFFEVQISQTTLAMVAMGVTIAAPQCIISSLDPLIHTHLRPLGCIQLRVLCVYFLLIAWTALLTYVIVTSYGWTHWCTVIVLSSRSVCVSVVTSIFKYLIYAHDDFMTSRFSWWQRTAALRFVEQMSSFTSNLLTVIIVVYYFLAFSASVESFTKLSRAESFCFSGILVPYVVNKSVESHRQVLGWMSSLPRPDPNDARLNFGDCSMCLKHLSKRTDDCRVTPCGHVFHEECLVRWLQTRSGASCPECYQNFAVNREQEAVPDDAELLTRALMEQLRREELRVSQ